jgi:Fic family protein
MPLKPDDQTEISPAGGYFVFPPRQTKINPADLEPKNVSRFKLREPLVAKIEAIGRARVKIYEYKFPDDPHRLWQDEEELSVLAQSVIASSEIEGEEVSVDIIPLIVSDEPNQIDDPSDSGSEVRQRLGVVRSIYKAYVWALTNQPQQMVSPEFICELHYRMFCDSTYYGPYAGKLKDAEVNVQGSRYYVETLASARVPEALRCLCDRTNDSFRRNRTQQSKPLLTIIGEFVIDFLAIHPFRDGNGRLARLLSTYLLDRIGYHFSAIYPMDTIINDRRAEYFEALFSGQRNWYTIDEDLTQWIEFYVDAIYEQWERAHRKLRHAQEIWRPSNSSDLG